MSKVIEGLKYTEEHEWVQIEGDIATIGVTDFAQSSLGDIVFVELPELEAELDSGAAFGVIESIKSVSDLYSPLTGVITEKNDSVEDSPELVNEDPYSTWLVKMKISDSAEIEKLMDSSQYTSFCESNS